MNETPVAEWEQKILDRQAEDMIRADERERIAARLEGARDVLADFATDRAGLVDLVVHLIRTPFCPACCPAARGSN